MRTTTTLALCLLGAGSALNLLQPTAGAAVQYSVGHSASGLAGPASAVGGISAGFQIADTYYSQLVDDATGASVQTLTTYRADGTVDGVDNDDLGLGLGSMDSAAHGTWKVLAPGQFETVLHYFTYDAAGNHQFTVRATIYGSSSTTIPAEGVPFDVTYVADIFLPSQNPALDLPVVPGFASGSGLSWRMP